MTDPKVCRCPACKEARVEIIKYQNMEIVEALNDLAERLPDLKAPDFAAIISTVEEASGQTQSRETSNLFEGEEALDDEQVAVFHETKTETPASYLEANWNPQVLFVAQMAAEIKNRRKKTNKERRQVKRLMRQIQWDLERIYPNADLLEAISVLLDQDLVWSGDFDDLREPLAELLIKLQSINLFNDELVRLAKVLIYTPK